MKTKSIYGLYDKEYPTRTEVTQMKTKTIEKIEKRIGELEEIAEQGLDWEQVIYSDRKYEVTLLRDYYDEAGFYIISTINDEKAELKELPEAVLEEALEILDDIVLEEAIEETVHED